MAVTYQQARDALAERLTSGALEHSERVASSAVSLAALYGVSETDAALAGLLHDWARETPPEQLVKRARELGLEVTDADVAVPYLLHGPVGAADITARLPELSAQVIDAIETHTFGSQEMTPLAMVVYVADIIEPSRTHDGVQALREAAGVVPLEQLYADAYARSLGHLVETRRRIHPRTVEAWNAIVARADR